MATITERLARYRELNAKRTQGCITLDKDKQRPFITTTYDGHNCLTEVDVGFYNQAPAMYSDLEALHGMLERVGGVLYYYANHTPSQYESYDHDGRLMLKVTGLEGGMKAAEALAAINAIMGKE